MSRRSDILHAASWYTDWTPYKVTPDELIYIFEEAGCEQIPTRAQANAAMTQSTGVVMGNVKHWCGIFCCTVLREAGLPVRWTLTGGRMTHAKGASGVIKLTYTGSLSGSRAGIQAGDIGIIPAANHHFLILGVDESAKQYTTLEGNTTGQVVLTRTRPFNPSNSSQKISAYWKIM